MQKKHFADLLYGIITNTPNHDLVVNLRLKKCFGASKLPEENVQNEENEQSSSNVPSAATPSSETRPIDESQTTNPPPPVEEPRSTQLPLNYDASMTSDEEEDDEPLARNRNGQRRERNQAERAKGKEQAAPITAATPKKKRGRPSKADKEARKQAAQAGPSNKRLKQSGATS
ncbi:hypothetical protein BJV82DRAFT_662471 [Fennellomyces sp. T-0311]|nr:hypothetical protein BJV82DRAFT_662471 [Fennellomyces sp. T-0311]